MIIAEITERVVVEMLNVVGQSLLRYVPIDLKGTFWKLGDMLIDDTTAGIFITVVLGGCDPSKIPRVVVVSVSIVVISNVVEGVTALAVD